MNVELIAYSSPMPYQCGTACYFNTVYNPMHIIEQAASVCYDSEPDFVKFKIAKGCAKTGHLSVYEHAYFTFHVKGISRACLAQLTRASAFQLFRAQSAVLQRKSLRAGVSRIHR